QFALLDAFVRRAAKPKTLSILSNDTGRSSPQAAAHSAPPKTHPFWCFSQNPQFLGRFRVVRNFLISAHSKGGKAPPVGSILYGLGDLGAVCEFAAAKSDLTRRAMLALTASSSGKVFASFKRVFLLTQP